MRNKGKMFNIMLLALTAMMLSASVSSMAQTGSLKVFENIAGGTLVSTWLETGADNWVPGKLPSGGVYNCTTKSTNWTIPIGSYGGDGHRWFQTYNIKVNDSNLGIGCIYAYDDTTHWDGWVYILEDFYDKDPGFYLVKNDAGTIKYRNATTWITNMSAATDYSGNCEVDYLNSVCRVKSVYDGYSKSLRVKIWNPSGSEPHTWMYDVTGSSLIKSTTSDNMSCGLLAISKDGYNRRANFQKIFFWNLSYDQYDSTTKPEIRCPTYNAMEFFDDYQDWYDANSFYNSTQLLRTFINRFDLISFYTNDQYGGDDQNDTTYHFSIMITDTRDYINSIFDQAPDWAEDFPDNILYMKTYLCPDGSDNDSDYMLIRIDTDNNGVYDTYDYAIWTNDTIFRFYQGDTTVPNPEDYIYFYSGAGDPISELFRDDLYYSYVLLLNWDLIYNGATDERVGSDVCRMSISWYNKDRNNLSVLQDWNESADITMKSPSELKGWDVDDATTSWLYFYVDESISGDEMADPDDPLDYSDFPGLEPIMNVLPILASAVFFAVLVMMMWANVLTVDTLIAWLIAFVVAVLGIVIMIGVT